MWMPSVERRFRRNCSACAEIFVELQEARHEADYKLDRTFTARERKIPRRSSRPGISGLENVRSEPIAKVYLASLLLWRRWR